MVIAHLTVRLGAEERLYNQGLATCQATREGVVRGIIVCLVAYQRHTAQFDRYLTVRRSARLVIDLEKENVQVVQCIHRGVVNAVRININTCNAYMLVESSLMFAWSRMSIYYCAYALKYVRHIQMMFYCEERIWSYI